MNLSTREVARTKSLVSDGFLKEMFAPTIGEVMKHDKRGGVSQCVGSSC